LKVDRLKLANNGIAFVANDPGQIANDETIQTDTSLRIAKSE